MWTVDDDAFLQIDRYRAVGAAHEGGTHAHLPA